MALAVIAVAVDHQGRHVVDREERRRRWAGRRQGLEDHRAIDPPEIGAADIVGHEYGAETQCRPLAQGFHGEFTVLVPPGRMGRHLTGGEIPRQSLERLLIVAEFKVHGLDHTACRPGHASRV